MAALGRPAYINLGRAEELPAQRDVDAMRRATYAVLDAAYAAGVRWIDVARSYGRAEEFLAGWLARREHHDLTISSKWGYTYVGAWRMDAAMHEVKEHSASSFSRQWSESRALLGSAINLYQVHSLTVDSPLFTDEPLQRALSALGDDGVRVGFSTSGPRQGEVIRRAFDLQVAGRPIFTAVQSTWNVLEPSAGRALAEAHAAGNLVLVKETLANGRLVVAPPAVLGRIAARHGVGPDAVAVAAVLARPWADVVLVGPASPAQLSSNLGATGLNLADGELRALATLAETPGEYWGRRSSLHWR
ncbi:aryl-alcohol dehydrogenase-like predicted oxidoreductase [Amycolatopsis bartoniae]|uniref:Aldo/keto reductase n=2 Tax=Amycolatopsis bartoniae TaxID=941986 RepID=A0A8H9MC70_9PSEU|nr:aryl-alcohol dehydrogenase-like predicted oxidoreductase [Amycolatopsis bartoniae]GHF51707.1 aldo/keto reductase [Amycolatopsis bartoniae]